MDKRDISRIFRQRLLEAIERAQINRAQLAERAGIDRSTLTQLLTGEGSRMPRADTVAGVAAVLQVSLDWLLGLSAEETLGAVVLQESLQIAPRSRSPVDEDLARWHEEAAGYKIRYVPSSLPDLLKNDDVIEHEYRDYLSKTADQAIAAKHGKLALATLPDADVEICLSRQALEGFAFGEGLWRGLPAAARHRQLEHMIAVLDERYPSVRLYLFDGLEQYAAPYTVFGPLRAALFIGQMYFVFTTTEHIRALARHFDGLIRAALVQASDVTVFLRDLCEQVRAGGAGDPPAIPRRNRLA